VYRLYDKASFLARDQYTIPEIRRVDLTDCALHVASMQGEDFAGVEQFPWFEQPDDRLWANAFVLLRRLGMIDESDRITEWGRRAHEVPLHPRHAAIFLRALDEGR